MEKMMTAELRKMLMELGLTGKSISVQSLPSLPEPLEGEWDSLEMLMEQSILNAPLALDID
jgi:hypothetical protein